ncbi:MAG: hypothetical protein QM652_11295 [Legionella sp.]|uniref:hypothetical protein n=1 Tax=Legionella sp. TaxID=459 RepID=UPI0039E3C291
MLINYLRQAVDDSEILWLGRNIFLLGMFISNTTASSLNFFLGTAPDNGIQIGSSFHHVVYSQNYPSIMWKPNLGATYHSLNITYFKSCDNDDAMGIGIQRNLINKVSEKSQLSIGYRLGMTYGAWCINRRSYVNTASDPHCKDHFPILPAVELYVDYSYRGLGIEAAVLGPVVALSLIKVWGK